MHEGRARGEWGRTSALLAMVYNVNIDPKKTKPAAPDDFNPYAERRPSDGSRDIEVPMSVLLTAMGARPDAKPDGQ